MTKMSCVLRMAYLLLLFIPLVHAETTPLDSNFFLFEPADVFAVRENGQWEAPRFPLRVGLEITGKHSAQAGQIARQFILDASHAASPVPAACRQRFSSTIDVRPVMTTLPKAIFAYGEVERLGFFRPGCAATLWLSGPRSYWGVDRFETSDMRPPQDRSVSHGLVEFRAGDATVLVQFAVAVKEISR